MQRSLPERPYSVWTALQRDKVAWFGKNLETWEGPNGKVAVPVKNTERKRDKSKAKKITRWLREPRNFA
jgi:hypothetical protein